MSLIIVLLCFSALGLLAGSWCALMGILQELKRMNAIAAATGATTQEQGNG